MRVAIIGAGVAGLVNARVLLPLGVDVVVFEARSDVGGVWSATRGYPGQRIQNDKRAYALSDLPMPDDLPEHPDRAQVQAYLAAYAHHHGLEGAIRLSTTVSSATYDPDRSTWLIESEGPGGAAKDRFDWLIVANGTLSTPAAPVLAGREAFEAAGGTVVDAADLGEHVDLDGRRVAILGYGKSATDIAVAALGRAAAITVLARSVPWKLPERIGPVSFQHLVNTRLGEHLLWAPHRTLAGRALRRLDTVLRFGFRRLLAHRLLAGLPAEGRSPRPGGTVQALSHLLTPGFDEAVRDGRIDLRTGVRIDGLGAEDGRSAVRLTDGSVLPVDLLVAATGYRTDVSFLDERTRSLLVDARGGMPLIRHTRPTRAPALLFAGWAGSFRSPIASELQAMWIGAFLLGVLVPSRRAARPAGAPTGLSILDQDAWLHDAGLDPPVRVVLRELVRPLDPADYADLHGRLQRRVAGLAGVLPDPEVIPAGQLLLQPGADAEPVVLREAVPVPLRPRRGARIRDR